MQQPTHPRLHLRDARDAHTIFEAVRSGLLKPVTRRLNELERAMHVRSGAVFVWEESDDEIGLKRWTDGRIWSQSRLREPYLFYDEKIPGDDNHEQPRSPSYRFVDAASRPGCSSSAMAHFDRSNQHPTGLVKQAYSAWVMLTPNGKQRKWHLTAYFTYADLQNIPTIDQDPLLRRVTVPPGIYRNNKARSKEYDIETLGHAPMSPSAMHPARPSSTPPYLLPMPRPCPGLSPLASRMQPRPAEDQRMIQMLDSRHLRW